MNHILYVTGSKNSVIISLDSGADERFYMAFHQIENLLPNEQFIRIHKSYIVAINKIERIEGSAIRLTDLRVNFPIGITYKGEVNKLNQPQSK